jgi:hypothetical protein
MKLPGLPKAAASERKMTAYLLSRTHPTGRHKAEWLIGHGFAPEAWTLLAEALRRHAAMHEVAAVEESPFGTRYVVEGTLVTPDGRNPLVRAVVHRGGYRCPAARHGVPLAWRRLVIKELDNVVLTVDLPAHRLREGDVGTVVLVHPAGGYEVEFVTLTGESLAVVSLQVSQVRPIGAGEIAHARHVAA